MTKRNLLLIAGLGAFACASAGSESASSGDRQAPVAAGVTSTTAQRDPLVHAIDSLADGMVRQGAVAGVSVAVLRRGEPLHVRGYGTADVELSVPATDSTRFYVGSISKSITAAAVLRLVETNRVGLDDEVSRHLPGLDVSGPPITVRQLLNHTSGLPGPQQLAPKFVDRRHLEFSRDQLLEMLRGEPLVSAPGERFAYNNFNYLVLGMLVERISGQGYEDYLREHVLSPVAAGSVLLCDSRRIIPHRATGYQVADGAFFHHEPVNASLVFAAGGLCGNAADVANWLRALATGRIIGAESFARMSAPLTLNDGSTVPYGLGLFVDDAAGHRRVHHGGDVNGFSAHAAYYQDADLTIVVLTNTRGGAARELEQQIARRALNIADPPQ